MQKQNKINLRNLHIVSRMLKTRIILEISQEEVELGVLVEEQESLNYLIVYIKFVLVSVGPVGQANVIILTR